MIECLLFDCDGTLVDSERLCNVVLSVQFRELGIHLDADELVRRFRGRQLAAMLDLLQQEHAVTLPDGFIGEYRRNVAEVFETELKPVPGIEAALEQLDYPKAVVSSGPRHKIEQALRVCNLARYFEGNIYSSYEVGAWKPDPRIYEFAARDMGCPPEACAVIEDGIVGVEAAVNAGIRTYFYNPFHETYNLPGIVSFRSMSELPKLIARDG